ncbi:MAG TPA: EAL domain-containing protein, partial [Gemmatimonadota bacterium]|nr:EAL domain-containing protein [Gemmatimonadota bacterium]
MMGAGSEAAHYVARVSAIPTFTVTALLLGLGAMTLERERRSPEARAFFAVTLAAALWMFGFSWMNLSADARTAYVWFRVAYAGAPFIAPAMYAFAVRVLGIAERRRALSRAAWAYFGACAAVVLGTGLFVEGVRPAPWGYYPVFRPAGLAFVLPFLAMVAFTLRELWTAWRSADPGTPRLRARAFLVAFAAASLAAVDFLPAFGAPVYPVGFAPLVGFVVLAGAAIWRYRLADLGPAVAAEALLQTTAEFVALCDREGVIRHANPALCNATGRRPEALVGRPAGGLAGNEASAHALDAALTRSQVTSQEMDFAGREGASIPVSVSACELRDPHGYRFGTALLARDVRFQRQAREALERAAFYDPVTGLANRSLLLDRIRGAHARAGRDGQRFALLCVHLDQFERFLEGLGHAAADEIISDVATRVQVAVRDADTVARSAESQLAVLLGPIEQDRQAAEVARRILEALDPPVTLSGRTVLLSAAIGIALTGPGSGGPEAMLEEAHAAATRARGKERRRIQLYASDMRRDVASSLALEADLRKALEREELLLHYQPIARLADLGVVGFEALLRWRHPTRGLMGPTGFLPAARSARLLPRIGWWVIDEACRQLAAWRERFEAVRPLRVHVNLAAEELTHPELLQRIEAALSTSGLEAGRLTLEVTESTLLHETEDAIGIVDALRARGLRL